MGMNLGAESLWRDRPSQWVGLWYYAVRFPAIVGVWYGLFHWNIVGAAIFAVSAYPACRVVYQWLYTRLLEYHVTPERIYIERGVLNRTLDQCELYRVRDFEVQQPWWLRPLGLYNVGLYTSDRTTPILWFMGVHAGDDVAVRLREAVEDLREAKGIRAIEIDR